LQQVGGFREELPCSQERDLHLRLACCGVQFVRLPEVLYTVRRVTGSVSSNSTRVLDQHADVYWRAYRLLEQFNRLTPERARHFAGVMALDARRYLAAGCHHKAKTCFGYARQMHSGGGLDTAYYRRMERVLHRLVGPVPTAQLIELKRRLIGRSAAPSGPSTPGTVTAALMTKA
jgi:hypothetical protein